MQHRPSAFSYRFELAFGGNNLTGREPAITGDNQVQANTDPSLYDVLGRRYFASLRLGIK
jgi:iron complex outermembrane recepter protein